MPVISIPDLNNAKLDVDHLAEIANSLALTSTDRLGREKPTMEGLRQQYPNAEPAAAAANVSEVNALMYAGQASAARVASEAARDLSQAAARPYSTQAFGHAGTVAGQLFTVSTAGDPYTYTVYANNGAGDTLIGTLTIASGAQFKTIPGSLIHGGLPDANGGTLAFWKDDGFYFMNPATGKYGRLAWESTDVTTSSNSTTMFAVEGPYGTRPFLIDTKARMKAHGVGDVLDQVAASDFLTALEVEAFDRGTAVQAVSKAGAVTLNNLAGEITLHAAVLNAGASAVFTLTNVNITKECRIVLNHISGGTFGAYHLDARAGRGTADIVVRNLTAGALAEAIVVGFEIVGGSKTLTRYYRDKASQRLKQRIRVEANVRYHNQDAGVSFARMPTIKPLTNTTGLIFFTQRNSYYPNGENAQRACCVTYTVDLANAAAPVSLGPLVIIFQPPQWTNPVPGGWAVNPIAFVEGATGAHPGRLHCLFNFFDSPSGVMDNGEYYIADTWSDLGGAAGSWSAPVKIMGKEQVFDTLTGGVGGVPGALVADPLTRRYGPIMGTGNCLIVMEKAPYTNRIAVAINVLNDGSSGYSATWYQGAMVTDDWGATWVRGTLFLPAASQNEAQLVETSDGSVLRLTRDEVDNGIVSQLRRGQQRSVDGCMTWAIEPLNLTAKFNHCSGSLINTSMRAEDGYPKIIAGSSSREAYGQRDRFRFRVAYNPGANFIAEWAPFPDRWNIGYNFLAVNPDKKFILWVYEVFNGNPGWVNTEDSVCLMLFNMPEFFAGATLPT